MIEQYVQVSVPADITPFVERMVRELTANTTAKGDWRDWPQWDRNDAIGEIEHHTTKLAVALRRKDRERVAELSADVANMAMMTWWHYNRVVPASPCGDAVDKH